MERRRSRRHILCVELRVWLGGDGPVGGRLLDLSSAGAYVVVDAVIASQRLGHLSFGIDGETRRCDAFGRVVRCVFGDSDTGVGLTFTEHDNAFAQWIDTLDDVTESGRARVARLLRDVVLRLR